VPGSEPLCWPTASLYFAPRIVHVRAVRLVFDGFELDPEERQLYRDGSRVALEPRAFDLLRYFVDHPARLIKREELVEQVWRVRALSEGVLASTVAKLRKALDQAPDARAPLETVRGQGYLWHPAARPAAAPTLAVDPFVARAAPLAQLTAALTQAASGSGQLWLVAGDAGIGKTRLLTELAQRAHGSGYRTWWGAGYDAEAAPPYWPWVEIIRAAHLQLGAASFREHLPAGFSALAQLAPDLFATSEARVAPHNQRFALMDELSRFLEACSREQPLLLVLDDLHWADAATSDLLAFAARALARCRILIVASLRDGELALSSAAQQEAVQRLQRTAAATIALAGFSRAEVGELVALVMGDRAGDTRLVSEVFERSQGNPLFVREMLRLLHQQGERTLPASELPGVVRGVIERRVALLPEQTRRVLTAAAVIGTELDAQTIADLLDLALDDVLRALEPALRSRIVQPRDARELEFTHALVRDTLYAALSSAARGAMHARVAQLLLLRGAAADARRLAALAHHTLLAVPSQLSACVAHGKAAAAAARRSAGFEAAAAILARVVHKHERESSDLVERCELLLVLASDLGCVGDMREAWQVLTRGAELARKLGAAELLAQFAFALAPWREFGGPDEAYVRALQLEALAGVRDRAPAAHARLLGQLAQMESDEPLSERLGWLRQADQLAQRELQGEPRLLRQLAYARAVMRAPLDVAQSQRDITKFRALDAAVGGQEAEPLRLQQSLTVELIAYTDALASCDLPASEAALERSRVFARDAHAMGTDFLIDMVDAGRAHAAGELDKLELGIARLREASHGGGGFSLAWLRYTVLLAYERGVLSVLRAIRAEQFPPLTELPCHARTQGELFLAWTYTQIDEHEKARRQLADVSAQVLDSLPRQRDDLALMCMLAELYRSLGDRASGERLIEQLTPYAELNAIGPTYSMHGAVAHYIGLLHALLGRGRQARESLDRAIELNSRLQMPLQLARSQRERARVAAR
jgi:DNA-binding winged helix-turn-helix (wHTH) protein